MKEIPVSKNKLRWIWYCLAVAVLSLVGLMLYPSIIFSNTLHIVLASICVYLVIDGIVLIVCYGLMQKVNMLASWKIAAYLAIIVTVSICMNFLLSDVESRSILLFALIVFMILFFLNFAFSKIFFAVSVREAALIGIVMGLISSFLGILTSSVPN